ncbi:MAG: DUF2523 family protein [FCB group bacterium]|jgi:hypothetical protein|nr:DUF2523 family protein [FCB group bacterium]
MLSLPQILMLIAIPLVARVMSALGMGIISYVSINAFVDFIVSRVMIQIGAMTGSAVMVLALAGIFEALSIILSALSVKATLLALKRIGILQGLQL